MRYAPCSWWVICRSQMATKPSKYVAARLEAARAAALQASDIARMAAVIVTEPLLNDWRQSRGRLPVEFYLLPSGEVARREIKPSSIWRV